ncbi:MAG TPA: hypothetical protein VGG39_30730 [Polyangiaceae bacterium]|jgi:hypothetical protein
MRVTFSPGVALALFSTILVACSGAAPEDSSRTSEGLNATFAPYAAKAPSFVTIAASTKGGYDVTPANSSAGASHVAALDFSRSGFDASTVAVVTSAPTGEVLLEGTVATSTLYVTGAYRGMPGITHEASATFYEVSASVGHALNEKVTRTLDGIDVSAATAPFVSASWLENEVANKGAVVAGHVTQATKTLTAQQVYVALPYVGGPCVVSGNVCPGGEVPSFSRDENLCYDFAGCVTPGVCPLYVPECPAGYDLASWVAQPSACHQYSCEPSFLH